MLKIILTLAVLLTATHALGEDFILRSSLECCNADSAFRAGSEAILFNGDKNVNESKLKTDSHFIFENVSAGKYDLAVSAVGYYPEKYIDVEIGKNKVFDFELVAALRPTKRTTILEGHIIVWFKKTLTDKEILKRLGKWDFGVLHKRVSDTKSKPLEHRIERMYDYAEVRATYDRSKDLADLIWTALRDPSVIGCTPVYFSPK